MFLIGFIVGSMVGGTLAIFLHCCVIVGKQTEEGGIKCQVDKTITKD